MATRVSLDIQVILEIPVTVAIQAIAEKGHLAIADIVVSRVILEILVIQVTVERVQVVTQDILETAHRDIQVNLVIQVIVDPEILDIQDTVVNQDIPVIVVSLAIVVLGIQVIQDIVERVQVGILDTVVLEILAIVE